MDRHAATRRLHQLASAAGIWVTKGAPAQALPTFVTTMQGVDLRDV
jgi:integrase/recombinase XerD